MSAAPGTYNDGSLQGTWALVLGASSGFGEANSLALARAGANILGVHLDRRQTMPNVERITGRNRGHGAAGALLQYERRRSRSPQGGTEQGRGGDRAGRRARRPPLARLRHPEAVRRRRRDQSEADGHDARRDGALARLLGAGPRRARPPRRGRARLGDDLGGRAPRVARLRRGLGGEGGARGAHPPTRRRTGDRRRSPSMPSRRASPTPPRCAKSPATTR